MKRIFLLNIGVLGLLLVSTSIIAMEEELKLNTAIVKKTKMKQHKKAKRGGACVAQGTLKESEDLSDPAIFNHDGSWFIFATKNNALKVFDIRTGERLHVLVGHDTGCWGWIRSLTISRDGSRIVSASRDDTVKVWDAKSGNCLYTLEKLDSNSVAFSNDGSKIAVAHGLDVQLREANTGVHVRTLQSCYQWISRVRFSHDDSHIIAVSDLGGSDGYAITLWDACTGEKKNRLRTDCRSITSLDLSPHGLYMAVANGDTITIWDFHKSICLNTLKGHTEKITTFAFSSDDARIVSVSNDKTIKLWDVESGCCLGTVEGHKGSICTVTFSPDNTHIISASCDKTIKKWNTLRLIQLANKAEELAAKQARKKRSKATYKQSRMARENTLSRFTLQGDEARGCHEKGLPKACNLRGASPQQVRSDIFSRAPVANPHNGEYNVPQRSTLLSWFISYRAAIVTSGLLAVAGCTLFYTYLWPRHAC